jgi:hypothetical protein
MMLSLGKGLPSTQPAWQDLPAGLIAEVPGQAHRPKSLRSVRATPLTRHRRTDAASDSRAPASRSSVGCGEAQALTLVIASNGGLTLTEQLSEGEQIELVAMQARLDAPRPRLPVRARSSRLG